MRISGNYVYVADSDAGLRIIDVSNLQNLYEIGYYDIPGSARNIAVANDYIYVADEWTGLRSIEFYKVEIKKF